MTRPQLLARLRYLRRELRYVQCMNRVSLSALRFGYAQAKRMGAQMRAVQKQLSTKVRK